MQVQILRIFLCDTLVWRMHFQKMAYSNMSAGNLRGLGTNRKHLPICSQNDIVLAANQVGSAPKSFALPECSDMQLFEWFFMSSSHTPVLLIRSTIKFARVSNQISSFQVPAISFGAPAINDRKPAAPKSFPSLQKSTWKDDDSMICRKISFDTVL